MRPWPDRKAVLPAFKRKPLQIKAIWRITDKNMSVAQMRRTDRLYDLIQILRDGRLHRAADLARALDVSVRTIWRDMTTLIASGMPIEGERGVGYILRAPLTLPPMMITAAELAALRAGLQMVGGDLGRAAQSLAAKFAAVTPRQGEDAPHRPSPAKAFVPLLRRAIRARNRVTLATLEPQNILRHADMRPLALDLKSTIWTLTAFCEKDHGFRVIRLDRIIDAQSLPDIFSRDPGCELADFRALAAPTRGALAPPGLRPPP